MLRIRRLLCGRLFGDEVFTQRLTAHTEMLEIKHTFQFISHNKRNVKLVTKARKNKLASDGNKLAS